ncbi:hypothetical protein B0H14DRAFT_3160827 [Mycena olivaceomarginata]|nr:hypothetical protein B0H14DRAFT_3160827 [Mycena olivaceomarginata]
MPPRPHELVQRCMHRFNSPKKTSTVPQPADQGGCAPASPLVRHAHQLHTASLTADRSALLPPPPLPPHHKPLRLRPCSRRHACPASPLPRLCAHVPSGPHAAAASASVPPVPASPADAPPPASAPPCPSPPGRCLDSVRVPSRCRSARVLAGVDVPTSQRPRPVSAHARPAPRTSHTRTHLATAPCSACLSRRALSAHPFRPTSTPLPSSPPMRSHALLPASCPPPPLLSSAHPPSCRRTLVLSTDGDGMNRTAVRDHRIDLQALDRIIALGDASRTNAAALEAQRRPNPALQPVRGAAPAPGNLLERAARPLHRRVQVNTHELLRAALPPADPPALATVPRGGRVLVHYGLGSVRSSAFLGVFVIIYQGMPMLPAPVILYITPFFYLAFILPKTIVCVVVWAVEVLASVGRASGPAITLTWHPYRPSFITPTPRTALWFGRSKVSFESGGWAEAVDRVLAKQPAHRPRGTLLNGRPITYFGRSELSSALEGHAEAAGLEEAKRAPGVKQAVEAFFGAKIGTKCLLDGSKVSCVPSSYSPTNPEIAGSHQNRFEDHFKRQFSRRKLLQEVPPLYQALTHTVTQLSGYPTTCSHQASCPNRREISVGKARRYKSHNEGLMSMHKNLLANILCVSVVDHWDVTPYEIVYLASEFAGKESEQYEAYLNNLIRVKNNLSTHDTRNKQIEARGLMHRAAATDAKRLISRFKVGFY